MDVVNETDLPLDGEAVSRVVYAVLRAEEVTGGLAVAFVSEEAMAELNSRYRALPGATDVLSFPYRVEGEEDDEWPEPEDAGDDGSLGDIVICPGIAAAHAQEDRIPLAEELGRLMIHGVLHLLGYDHEVDSGEMMARQDALLAELAPLHPAILPRD